MNNDLILAYVNVPEDSRKQAAEELHDRIIQDANQVANSLLDMCISLKTMRDTKLYIDLGFETFEEYVEVRAGFKQRQAYTYISAYEKLGTQFLQSNAKLGITKLSLLSEVSGVDREEFAEENDLASLSVKEIEALIREKDDRGEQISLLQNTIEEKNKELSETDRLKNELEELKKQNSDLSEWHQQVCAERDELQSRTVDVAVAEPSQEELDKIKEEAKQEALKAFETEKKAFEAEKKTAVKEAKEKAQKAAQKEAEKEIAKAKEEAEKAAADKMQKAMEEAEAEKAAAIEKANRLAKQMEVSADSDFVTASMNFDLVQEHFNRYMGALKKITERDPEKAGKLKAAARQLLSTMLGQVGE